MPGYQFDDSELQKLFAEAGDAVKKHTAAPAGAAPEAAAPAVPAAPVRAAVPVVPIAAAVEPPAPVAAPTPVPPVLEGTAAGEPLRIVGGEQASDAFSVRLADGQVVRLPWQTLRGLTLARVSDRQTLAFVSQSTMYYFQDDNVAYKGLIRSLQATTAMNWRQLVIELASLVPDAQRDAGVQVLTGGGGGSLPKYLDRSVFFAAVGHRG